jgi:CheY-like chemotaxis protein
MTALSITRKSNHYDTDEHGFSKKPMFIEHPISVKQLAWLQSVMGQFTKPSLRVLMADDSEEDRFFVQRALAASGVGSFFQGVGDGSEAIDYLRGKGSFGDRKEYPFPNVLLLDIKMPGLGGFDVLKWLGKHPECKVIPTIVFSSSGHESDIHESYVLGANAFMVKPTSADELAHLIQLTYEFWSHCETPAPPPGQRCC